MSDVVRGLRQEGLRLFREYLQRLREGSRDAPPREILTRADTSAPLDLELRIEPVAPADHFGMAQYLTERLRPLALATREDDPHLWSWLSLYYFDLVCPLRSNGSRIPGRDYRHIPQRGFRYAHRHLLAGPFVAYGIYGDRSRFMLRAPLHRESMIFHELCSRQSFISNPAVIEAAGLLYYDSRRGVLRRRAAGSREEPGGLYRFVNVIQQLDLTYDLYSLAARDILGLLPGEFDRWQPAPELYG